MSDLEESYEFGCPYCLAHNAVDLDVSGGRRQSFVVDCETCCQPILISVEFSGNEVVTFDARPENE